MQGQILNIINGKTGKRALTDESDINGKISKRGLAESEVNGKNGKRGLAETNINGKTGKRS